MSIKVSGVDRDIGGGGAEADHRVARHREFGIDGHDATCGVDGGDTATCGHAVNRDRCADDNGSGVGHDHVERGHWSWVGQAEGDQAIVSDPHAGVGVKCDLVGSAVDTLYHHACGDAVVGDRSTDLNHSRVGDSDGACGGTVAKAQLIATYRGDGVIDFDNVIGNVDDGADHRAIGERNGYACLHHTWVSDDDKDGS